jgi:hypothetical protein
MNSLLARQLLPELLKQLRNQQALFSVSLAAFLSNQPLATTPVEHTLGMKLSALLNDGLTHLLHRYPAAAADAILIGPALEGIGWYPAVTQDLQLPGLSCWVAGDATGIFRGLIAAMVSGYYCGFSVRDYLSR